MPLKKLVCIWVFFLHLGTADLSAITGTGKDTRNIVGTSEKSGGKGKEHLRKGNVQRNSREELELKKSVSCDLISGQVCRRFFLQTFLLIDWIKSYENNKL